MNTDSSRRENDRYSSPNNIYSIPNYEKPQNPNFITLLAHSIAHSIENIRLHKRFSEENEDLYNLPRPSEELIGNSPQTHKISSLVDHISKHNVPVLIVGELGTEKELIAKTLHYQSPRNSHSFISVRCDSSELLFECELFGFENIALQESDGPQKGNLEQANKGTIFLDEVTQISLKTQKRLLRFIERGEMDRIGSYQPISLDVRLIAASSNNLEDAVASGELLDELYHYLNPIKIEVSPLRTRKADIPLIIESYLEEFYMGKKPKRVSQSALDLLMAYDWPGNIRELRKVIERAAMLGKKEVLYPQDLPEYIQEKNTFLTMEEMKDQYILTALRKAGGNISKAASMLDMGRATLYARLK